MNPTNSTQSTTPSDSTVEATTALTTARIIAEFTSGQVTAEYTPSELSAALNQIFSLTDPANPVVIRLRAAGAFLSAANQRAIRNAVNTARSIINDQRETIIKLRPVMNFNRKIVKVTPAIIAFIRDVMITVDTTKGVWKDISSSYALETAIGTERTFRTLLTYAAVECYPFADRRTMFMPNKLFTYYFGAYIKALFMVKGLKSHDEGLVPLTIFRYLVESHQITPVTEYDVTKICDDDDMCRTKVTYEILEMRRVSRPGRPRPTVSVSVGVAPPTDSDVDSETEPNED